MKLSIQAGSTAQTVHVFVRDSSSTTGAGLTGLAFNTASLTAYYLLPRSAPAAITLATLASATAAWSSGGFREIDATNAPGWYRLDLPDAALAAGRFVGLHLKGAASMAPCPVEIELTAVNNQDPAFGLNAAAVPTSPASGTWGSAMAYADARVGRRGTAQGGTSTTITLDAGASAVDGTYKEHFIKLTGGTGSGQFATISAYVGSTKVATIARPAGTWSTTPDATSTFLILPMPVVDLLPAQSFNNAGQTTKYAATIAAGDNSDKAGYSLTQAFPANFASLSLTAGGKVSGVVLADTVTTYTGNTPQTGDNFPRLGAPVGASLSADIQTRSTYAGGAVASVTGAVGSVTGNVGGSVGSVTAPVTAGTVTDKAGYTLTQGFPANFAVLSISGGGSIASTLPGTAPAGWITTAAFASGATVPRVTLADTLTTYTGNVPQTGDTYAAWDRSQAAATVLSAAGTTVTLDAIAIPVANLAGMQCDVIGNGTNRVKSRSAILNAQAGAGTTVVLSFAVAPGAAANDTVSVF